MNRTIALAVSLSILLFATPTLARNKAELVDAIASGGSITRANAQLALDAFVTATAKALKKGDRIGLVGFGSFSVAKRSAADGPAEPPDGSGKAVKVAFRDGTKGSGTLALGPNGTWDLTLGLPSLAFVDDPLEIEVKLPKPFDPKVLEMEIGLPSAAPGTTFRALLDSLGSDGLLLEISFAGNSFDEFTFNPGTPSPDYLAPLFPQFHDASSSDPAAEPLLSERIGFGGVPLCTTPGGCTLSPTDRDGLLTAMAAASGLDPATTAAALDAILALHPPGPLQDAVSFSGFGAFSVSKRAARTGRNPQTGKEIKIAAKKVAKFKAGADLAKTVNK